MAESRLSALARLLMKGRFEEFDVTEGPQTNVMNPTRSGVTRGSIGSMGSRPFQSRDPDAGLKKERNMLNSPIMKSFLQDITL